MNYCADPFLSPHGLYVHSKDGHTLSLVCVNSIRTVLRHHRRHHTLHTQYASFYSLQANLLSLIALSGCVPCILRSLLF